MGTIIRGAKNAFRNTIRTFSVTLILAISIGLALVMLLAYKTVSAKIETVKSSIGNTITIDPAGGRGFEGGGEPITQTQMNSVKTINHVTKVDSSLSVRMTAGTDTNLATAIDPGTLGTRVFNRNNNQNTSNRNQPARIFSIPIMLTGINDTSILKTSPTSITSGDVFDGSSGDLSAVVGKSLASKNNLSVGSTFTAYTKTITVKGIFDSGNQFANSSLYLPLSTVQQLSGQTDEVSTATAYVDSITNLDSTVKAIQSKLGTDKVDVTSSQDTSKQAVAPLENVKNISLYSLFGSLAAGAIITLLTMMMIVRERRREIGVLKAIGASNITVVTQFVSESLVLTLLGSIVGAVIGFFLSNPILSALVTSTSNTTQGQGIGRGFGRLAQFGGQNIQGNIRSIHAVIGYDILLYGLLAAIAIAIIGSAIPAFLIAKVRPAEVMRGE